MKTYLVGGAVRDRLLGGGFPTGDRDWVVVGGTPEAMLADGFTRVGRDFPVFLHPQTGEEHALARTERRTGPGHADFVCDTDASVTLEQDLQRRDLTVNAIAWDGERYIDPYGGQRDIAKRVLRHVSSAFAEDPLRVFRVARFAAQLPEFSVSDETLALMASMVPDLDALAGERVWRELAKAVAAPSPVRFFEVVRALGGTSWFDDLDLDATVALFRASRTRAFHNADLALVALGWVHSAMTIAHVYARLRAPRLLQRAAPALATHGRTLTDVSAAAEQVLDTLTAIDAFRQGDLATLVMSAAERCADVDLDFRRRLIEELRRLRVDAQPGPAYGSALRRCRLRHIQTRHGG